MIALILSEPSASRNRYGMARISHGQREQGFRHMLLFAHGLHTNQAGRIRISRD